MGDPAGRVLLRKAWRGGRRATLDLIGLAPSAVRAYRMLLRLPTASVGELAAGMNMSIVEVRRALSGLEAKGLVGRMPGATNRFQAVRSAAALTRRRYREPHSPAADVEATAELPGRSSIQVVIGAEAVASQVKQMVASASEGLSVAAGTPVDGLDNAPGAVEIRLIYPHRVLDDENERSRAARQVRLGAHVRTGARIPDLVIVDRAMALLPVADNDGVSEGMTAVVVWSGGLRDSLIDLFESRWATGVPLVADRNGNLHADPTSSMPAPADLVLLRLLLDGLTDQAIAGRMGLGERTVQRRVRDLIDLVGAQTRLQLIWQATQRGWI